MLSEADRIKRREDQIAQIDAARHLTESEKQQLRDMYDRKTFGTQVAGGIIDIGAKIADDVRTAHKEHEAFKDGILPERGTVARALTDAALQGYSDKVMVVVTAGVYTHIR